MSSKLTIFDHFARPLAEINAPTTPRSWVLDGYGRCEFSISTSDPKCTLNNLQFGNLIHIEHLPSRDENGTVNGKLPDWVGMILPPRKWDLGVCHVVAYSAEAILAYRAMPFVTLKGTPKVLFTKILEEAKKTASNIIIQQGIIEDAAVTIGADLRTSAYNHIRTIAETAGMNWDVTGEIDPYGKLQLYANLYQSRGVMTGLTMTNTNSELQGAILTEQGSPANVVYGYSQSNTPQSRYKKTGINQAAMDAYGPLESNQVFMGQKDPAGVEAAAQEHADRRGFAVRMAHRVALDDGETFSSLEVGNRINIRETNAGFSPNGGFGFEAQARIISLDYNDLSNKCPLNLEVE